MAEVSGFDIADLACNGETQRAIASTRRALQLGIDPIVLAAALGGNIAAIARALQRPQRTAKPKTAPGW